MKQAGDILLLSCYELGHQPVAIASPLGFLRAAGFRPSALDLSVEALAPEKVRSAKFIGISVPMHTALRLGARVARQVRDLNPDGHICFYGLYAHLNADYLLRHEANSVLGGEFEAPLLATVEALEKGLAIDGIRGITNAKKKSSPFLERLSFVPPSRQGLPPLQKYAHLEDKGALRLVGSVEASRGCRHLCRHCPIPPVYAGRFFVIPVEIVLEDVRQLVAAGASHISFGDADFLNGPGHSLKIVRAMHQEFPSLSFDLTTKIEHILQHREIFSELKTLGCLFVISAVESLNEEVLKALRKGHTRSDVATAMKILKDAGIDIRPSLVPFTPWETLESYLGLLDFVENEALIDHVDLIHYSIRLLVPPGSTLLSEPEIQPHLGALDEETLSYAWRHPDPRMDELQRQVSQIVVRANGANEDHDETFVKLKTLALQFAGKKFVPHSVPHSPLPKPPRLTESWFCCAEPTQEQFSTLDKRADQDPYVITK